MTLLSRRAVYAPAAVVVVAAALAFTVSLEAWIAVDRGAADGARGDSWGAIRHYEKALRWYAPWSGSVRRAVEGLWLLGETAEQEGNLALASEAYRALRAGCLAARSFYLPFPEKVAACEARLGRIGGVAADTRRPIDPTPGHAALTCVGLVGWIGCTVGFIRRSLTREGRLLARPALFWGALTLIFYGTWIAGMAGA